MGCLGVFVFPFSFSISFWMMIIRGFYIRGFYISGFFTFGVWDCLYCFGIAHWGEGRFDFVLLAGLEREGIYNDGAFPKTIRRSSRRRKG